MAKNKNQKSAITKTGKTISNQTIYPVIFAVPEKERSLTGRDRVAFLSRHARSALEISAQKRNIILGDLTKDENGAPLPFNGNHWSLTHKPNYVGGVIASTRIGIDIEEIRFCSAGLFKKTAGQEEWRLSDMDPDTLFFRYWTSKETVLKASGSGIRDLSKCRVVQIVDDNHLIVHYEGREWRIEHFFFDGHIASVVQNEFQIEWILISANGKKNEGIR
ncbi:4'-phosphopantetheinyl transferase family protein [Thermodesulfobacteriota bacterium]